MGEASELGQAALDYAKAGWHIFPVKPRDKTPITAHGLQDASSKVETVRAWWQRWPEANIGLNCGKSDIVVIDLDKHGEHDGLREWQAISASHGLDLSTSTSLTGGGGRHLLFKRPPGVSVKNSAGKLGHGIDVRGDGGYIVLPPSVHPSGQLYQWETVETQIEPLPEVLVQMLTQEPDPWQVYTLRDAFKPRPPLVWLVDRVLSAGSLSVWYGPPGTLKSMLLADLAVCLAAGLPWLINQDGSGGFATSAGGVMWLDFDNGARRTHERFAALARSRDLPDSAPLYYVSMPDPHLDAGDTAGMGALAGRVVSRDVQLVVVDNLGVVCGEADENSAEMQRPMQGLRWLTEATGAAVVVLHHQRKANGLGARSGDTLRGHGSIEAKIDLGILVTRDGSTISLKATKARGVDVPPFSATFTWENDEAHELVTAAFWESTLGDDEAQADLEAEILSALQGGEMNVATVTKTVGARRQVVADTLSRMARLGQLKVDVSRGGRLKVYRIPDAT